MRINARWPLKLKQLSLTLVDVDREWRIHKFVGGRCVAHEARYGHHLLAVHRQPRNNEIILREVHIRSQAWIQRNEYLLI
jgi:hypothetical protein